jgi:hypothetical protein
MNTNLEIEKKVIEFKKYKEENEKLKNTCELLIKEYREKIEEYNNNIQKAEDSLKEQLFRSIPDADFKETKTQFNYRFPSGSFIKKKPSKSIKLRSDYKESEIPKDFIKIKKSVDWINFKKNLIINDDKIINKNTGEIIESCEIETKPEEFRIKI